MHLGGFDHAFRVDDEGAAQRQAFFVDVHAEGARQLVRGVAHQRELRLANGRAGLVPHPVREVGVGGDDVDLGLGLLARGPASGKQAAAGVSVQWRTSVSQTGEPPRPR